MQSTPGQQNLNDLIEPDEKVLTVVRKHWFGAFGIAAVCFVALIALLGLGILLSTDPTTDISPDTRFLILAIGILVVGIIILMMLAVFYIYSLSSLTITERSIVQVIQSGLFSKKTSRLSMSNVEDVSVEQKGFLPSALNYGTLTVQTAGEEDNFIFPFCPYPNRYAELILSARQKYADTHLERA